jgi:hypothetical protein
MGVPELEAWWNDLSARKLQGRLPRDEERRRVVAWLWQALEK